MAGKVVADQIEDSSANVGSTTDMIKGSARAWVSWNGSGTVAIKESYNVSSITDNGTGYYGVNFATPMDSANYAIALGGVVTGGGIAIGHVYWELPQTGLFRCRFTDTNATLKDGEHLSIVVFK